MTGDVEIRDCSPKSSIEAIETKFLRSNCRGNNVREGFNSTTMRCNQRHGGPTLTINYALKIATFLMYLHEVRKTFEFDAHCDLLLPHE